MGKLNQSEEYYIKHLNHFLFDARVTRRGKLGKLNQFEVSLHIYFWGLGSLDMEETEIPKNTRRRLMKINDKNTENGGLFYTILLLEASFGIFWFYEK